MFSRTAYASCPRAVAEMPRLANSGAKQKRQQQSSVRQTFFDWVYAQQRTSGTPVKASRKKRLNKLTTNLRDTLVAAVGEDDALVKMYDTHADFAQVHANAISFIDISSTGHRAQLSNLYSAVMTGTIVDGSEQTSNSMTTANFEAMKVAITDTLSKSLKSGHSPFPHHVRYIELLDTILGPGASRGVRPPCDFVSYGTHPRVLAPLSFSAYTHTSHHTTPLVSQMVLRYMKVNSLRHRSPPHRPTLRTTTDRRP